MESQKMLESMYSKLDKFLKTETVIGEPIEFGSVKLIPIISASFGLGGGFGEEEKNAGAGGGLGGKIAADAVLVVKDDEVEMLPVKSKKSFADLLEKVPEMVAELSGNDQEEDECCKNNEENEESEDNTED